MFSTLKTLITGANRRAEADLRDYFSIELIEEKIAEAEDNLKTAKGTLVALVQKERAEQRQLAALETQIAELTERARAALSGGREDLAATAADGIARMENEQILRQETLQRIEPRILRLRQSVEAAHRRILDLKQGLIAARTARSEGHLQRQLGRSLGEQPMDEAEALIANVLNQADPFEASDILNEIDTGLTPQNLNQTLAKAGFGAPGRPDAASVLERLKTDK